MLFTFLSVLVTIAPLYSDASADELVLGDFLTVNPSVQIILNWSTLVGSYASKLFDVTYP